MTPCGGTHVRRTGEVGLVAVCGFEKAKGLCRVEFRCGRRALRRFRALNETVAALSRALATSPADLPRMVAKLIEENKEKHRRIQNLTDQVLELEARARYADAPDRNGIKFIKSVFTGRDISEVKTLALKLIALPSALVLFAAQGEPAQVLFGRSADINSDMAALLRKACQEFGGRGGGRPDLAQGGGIPSDKVDAFLQLAEDHITFGH
jgi:alanyl-tRNA synthetase